MIKHISLNQNLDLINFNVQSFGHIDQNIWNQGLTHLLLSLTRIKDVNAFSYCFFT